MRKKPNLLPRMEKCRSVQLENPTLYFGNWRSAFPTYERIYVELGCGKGKFTCETAARLPNVLYVAVERVREAMVVAMERAIQADIHNVRFLDMDAAELGAVFAPAEIDRLYINFCDPWPGGKKRAKRRLTAPWFLNLYRQLLVPDGEIHFKTDNYPLFEYSLVQFSDTGFALSAVTNDLHGNGVCDVMTDYEEKFYKRGVPINHCVARKRGVPIMKDMT